MKNGCDAAMFTTAQLDQLAEKRHVRSIYMVRVLNRAKPLATGKQVYEKKGRGTAVGRARTDLVHQVRHVRGAGRL